MSGAIPARRDREHRADYRSVQLPPSQQRRHAPTDGAQPSQVTRPHPDRPRPPAGVFGAGNWRAIALTRARPGAGFVDRGADRPDMHPSARHQHPPMGHTERRECALVFSGRGSRFVTLAWASHRPWEPEGAACRPVRRRASRTEGCHEDPSPGGNLGCGSRSGGRGFAEIGCWRNHALSDWQSPVNTVAGPLRGARRAGGSWCWFPASGIGPILALDKRAGACLAGSNACTDQPEGETWAGEPGRGG